MASNPPAASAATSAAPSGSVSTLSWPALVSCSKIGAMEGTAATARCAVGKRRPHRPHRRQRHHRVPEPVRRADDEAIHGAPSSLDAAGNIPPIVSSFVSGSRQRRCIHSHSSG